MYRHCHTGIIYMYRHHHITTHIHMYIYRHHHITTHIHIQTSYMYRHHHTGIIYMYRHHHTDHPITIIYIYTFTDITIQASYTFTDITIQASYTCTDIAIYTDHPITIYIHKEELKPVVCGLLTCTQPNRHEIFTALWTPYRRVSSRGRRAQIRFSRGARDEKTENYRLPFWFYGLLFSTTPQQHNTVHNFIDNSVMGMSLTVRA